MQNYSTTNLTSKVKKEAISSFKFYYSVLNATTGSFLAADLAGRSPEIEVNKIDTKIIIIAVSGVKFAIFVTIPPDIILINIFANI